MAQGEWKLGLRETLGVRNSLVLLAISILITANTTSVAAHDTWVEPVPNLAERVDRTFLAPETAYGPGHRGVDFKVSESEPVSSPLAGEVAFKGKVVDRMVLTIRGFDGYLATFEPFCSDLDLWQEVKPGEVVGTWCEPDESYSRHCEEICLHISARLNPGYLNPLWLMRLIEPSRLMPLDELEDNLP